MPMISEVERRGIVDLIRDEKIKYFEDLLGPYKKSTLANDLKINRGEIDKFVHNVQRLSIRRVDQISDFLQVDPHIIFTLAHRQFVDKIKNKLK
jgi:plasmid maintenance system antidote protein VapI